MAPVETVEVTKTHTKQAEALATAVKSLVGSIKKALADGFQPGPDLTAIVMEDYTAVQAAVAGFGSLGDEVKEQQVPFIRTFTDMGLDVYEILKPQA